MHRIHRFQCGTIPLALVLLSLGLLAAGESLVSDEPQSGGSAARVADKPAPAAPRQYQTETLRGKVVWLDEALRRLHGITSHPDAAEATVALETSDGRLWPIIADARGQAFKVDERLRGTELELLVRRYESVPMIQVIRMFRRKADGLYEIDYWCDICAISMVILKDCECCQGPTRLREQLVETAADGNP